jgi:Methyltransferase domain
MHNADNVGDYLVSSRSLREYEAMFALTESNLRGAVLDCPGGASSFTVQASDLGAAAVAVDPVYAMSTSELRRLVMGEPDRGSAHTAAGADRYLWDFYGDLQGHRETRRNAAALFADDLEVHPGRYVPASLPVLPFEDGQFDLVLSSHFLFTYADRLDLGFHHRALLEMHRVCAGEVRVFPLLDQAGNHLDTLTRELRAALGRDGVAADVREVPYEFQRGGNRMLVLAAR